MNLEQVVYVQFVKMKQEDVKNFKSEKIQNHIKVVISQSMGLSSVKLVWVYGIDINGATNIHRIAKNAINGLERPKYLLFNWEQYFMMGKLSYFKIFFNLRYENFDISKKIGENLDIYIFYPII